MSRIDFKLLVGTVCSPGQTEDRGHGPHYHFNVHPKYPVSRCAICSPTSLDVAINERSFRATDRLLVYFQPNVTDVNLLKKMNQFSRYTEVNKREWYDMESLRPAKLHHWADYTKDPLKVCLRRMVPVNADYINNFLHNLVDKALHEEHTIFVFGSKYRDSNGIHDIHMNQGSTEHQAEFNAKDSDGMILIKYRENNAAVYKWAIYMAAFTSQMLTTNERGNPSRRAVNIQSYINRLNQQANWAYLLERN